MEWDWDNIKEVLTNNGAYYVQQMVIETSATTTLLFIGLFLAFMTLLKTTAYFLSSASVMPSAPALCATSATSSTIRLPRCR
jgi:subfamily B ATP-binding cassette protein MsbA